MIIILLLFVCCASCKKTTVQVETMTYNNRHRVNKTMDKKEKSPHFAFLILSASAHLAHPPFPTHKTNTQKSGKSQILPTHFNS